MERFDVRRGLINEVAENGGLAKLASEFFNDIKGSTESSFVASHGIMTSIEGSYKDGALIIDVTNIPPDFDDPEAMKLAMDTRKRWTEFLDRSTGYTSKQRGDKAKEWAKKASKAKSAISSARHFMELSENLSGDQISQADSLISEIEALLSENNNTKAAGRAEKLNKLFN
ncbi:MAG TPA: DUF5611 family protein [Candidatus Thalassarchaeaceae archaeon]|nr:DUF5611 family protein [Candidatus Thalassarchaeaceae archaeon]